MPDKRDSQTDRESDKQTSHRNTGLICATDRTGTVWQPHIFLFVNRMKQEIGK